MAHADLPAGGDQSQSFTNLAEAAPIKTEVIPDG
jgi:hypothetical protein